MSRYLTSINKLRAQSVSQAQDQQRVDIEEFKIFYQTSYYKKFKQDIENKLSALDRQQETDPGRLVLVQGQRNALITVLDELNGRERMINSIIAFRAQQAK